MTEFTEEYNELNSADKVEYNIQKCLQAINNKDYSYIYNKLDKEFRDNNYKTQDILRNTIQGNLFESNIIKNIYRLNEGATYIYKLTIINAEDESKTKDMTIIMQLKEELDFVMSFSFNI